MFVHNKRLQYTVRDAAPPGRKDMLFDIATEELSHLEIIGSIVAMRTKAPRVACGSR